MSVLPSQINAILGEIRAFPFVERNYIIEQILIEFGDDSELISRLTNTLIRIAGVNIKAKSRQRDVVTARFIAFHYLYHEEGLTLQELGQIFGKHHTSVHHAISTVKVWREDRKLFKNENKIYDKLKYLMSDENRENSYYSPCQERGAD